MKQNYVLVADATRARIFVALAPHGPLQELADMVHPEARLPARELGADSPGRSFDSKGGGRHALAEPTDPKRVEALAFARRIAETLQAMHAKEPSSGVVLVAAAQFLGLLRKQLDKGTLRAVQREVDKNFAQLDIAELGKRLGFSR